MAGEDSKARPGTAASSSGVSILRKKYMESRKGERREAGRSVIETTYFPNSTNSFKNTSYFGISNAKSPKSNKQGCNFRPNTAVYELKAIQVENSSYMQDMVTTPQALQLLEFDNQLSKIQNLKSLYSTPKEPSQRKDMRKFSISKPKVKRYVDDYYT